MLLFLPQASAILGLSGEAEEVEHLLVLGQQEVGVDSEACLEEKLDGEVIETTCSQQSRQEVEETCGRVLANTF